MNIETTYDQNPADRDAGPTILIVEDRAGDRHRLERALSLTPDANGCCLLSASTLGEALKILSSSPVHVVLLDKNLGSDSNDPLQNGIEMIPDMLHLQPHLQILMVTASGSVEDIVLAMRHGAFGYVTKEMKNEYVAQQIGKAIVLAKLEVQRRRRDKVQSSANGNMEFITRSTSGRGLYKQVQAVSESNRAVLLTGETGTGKTTIAEYIHEYRKQFLKQPDRPFFSVNISAMAPSLVEAELFGSEKGSFTGSLKMKQGFFELANGGTLFLDEIGEISRDVQKKLLTVLESGRFYRIGGTRELRSSFKLICATNKGLKELIAQGRFREDLYMRISTFTIEVPSLKDRRDDIPDIIRSLFPKCCRENNADVSFGEIPSDFIEDLVENIPPGNIRGLEQQLSRLLVFAPRDKQGRPVFKNWRLIPGLQNGAFQRVSRSQLSLQELMNLPLNVIGPDFPGLAAVTSSIEERILVDARSKLNQNRKIAQALKLSDSATGTRLKRLDEISEIRNRSVRKAAEELQ